MGNAESGSGEIEEEPSEPIFPLTRRGQKLGVQFSSLAKESDDAQSPGDEEDFSFNSGGDLDAEIFEEEDDERILGTHDEALSSRGDKNRFLSRIQEEETDECDDVSPPHEELSSRGDSPEALGNSTAGRSLPLLTLIFEGSFLICGLSNEIHFLAFGSVPCVHSSLHLINGWAYSLNWRISERQECAVQLLNALKITPFLCLEL